MLRELGQELRTAREQRGVTIADVQAETKIRSRYLEAIEQGKFDILPGDVYTKGFLRSYAEFLGLDGRAMVERYKQWQAAQEEAARSQAAPSAPSAPAAASGRKAARGLAAPAAPGAPAGAEQPADVYRRPANGRRIPGKGGGSLWAGLVLLLAASLAVGGWLAWKDAQAPSGPAAPPVEQPPAAGQPTAPSAPVDQEPAVAPAGYSLASVPAPDPYTVPFKVSGPAGKTFQITLSARENCWILLQRPGQDDVEEIVPAGATRTWEFTGQARLKLGNPPAVSLQVSGLAVPASTASFPVTYVFTQS